MKNIKYNDRREAFSAAEMLIVILILSFLVLAMPPFVHKKVKKRITRGEHGRFECWIDPSDGHTYQYYATEGAGPCDDCIDANGNPQGVDLGSGGVCSFDPSELASNASYFFFNAIGGGGGGSYASYDEDDTMYKNDDASVTATVYLSTEECASGYGTSTDGSCDSNMIVEASYSTYGSGTGYCSGGSSSSGTAQCYGKGGTGEDVLYYNYNYSNSISAYDEMSKYADWVQGYWIDVELDAGTVTVCSGRGYNGYATTKLYSSTVSEGSDAYLFYYGTIGAHGVCAQNAQTLFLSSDNSIKVALSQRTLGTDYFYAVNADGTTSTISTRGVTSKIDPYTADTEPVCAACACLCGTSYNGNYVYIDGLILYPGSNGEKTSDTDSYSSITTAAATFTSTSSWTNAGENSEFAASASGLDFPETIGITRNYAYDSTSIGYAGDAGESISLFLPKLPGTLEFEIGTGGSAGSAGSTALARAGTSGGDTIIRNADTNTVIYTAKGGLAYMGGEVGKRILMLGEAVLRGRSESTTSDGYPIAAVSSVCDDEHSFGSSSSLIDGCLDVGAWDNEKRFSEDSGFYTVVELDATTNTPSAIDELGLSPGSGGDGGYSFLRSTVGFEKISYSNHPQNPADIGLDYNYTYSSDGTGNTTYTSITNDYTCYKRNDSFGSPSGETLSSGSGNFCSPGEGYPGAVVIVW